MKDKLIKELELAGVNVSEWEDEVQLARINGALGNMRGIEMSVVGEDSGVLVVYYSKKLGRSIILTWDAYCMCDDMTELADHLMDYQKDAEALEKSITIK